MIGNFILFCSHFYFIKKVKRTWLENKNSIDISLEWDGFSISNFPTNKKLVHPLKIDEFTLIFSRQNIESANEPTLSLFL